MLKNESQKISKFTNNFIGGLYQPITKLKPYFDPAKLFAMLAVGGLIFMVFIAFIFFQFLLKLGVEPK